MSNKYVGAKYCVPKNNLSTWVKNRVKSLVLTEKGINIKHQKLRTVDF